MFYFQADAVVARIQFFKGCWTDGLSFHMAVGQRLSVIPCLFWMAICLIKGSMGVSQSRESAGNMELTISYN